MNKIFKMIFVMLIIFSLNMYSFAAISVSDGSAFVTKNEFSADLNTIANRVNMLQNSLDAKIDNLVSSYLSRNGIWDGSKQLIKGNSSQNTLSYFVATIGFAASSTKQTSGTFYNSVYHQTNGLAGQAASTIFKLQGYGFGGTYTVIENLNKSGLICVNYRYICRSGTPHNGTKYRSTEISSGRLGFYSSSFSYGSSSPLSFSFYEYTSDNKQVGDSLYDITQRFDSMFIQSADDGAKVVYKDEYSSFYAFVSKGNKLVVKTSSNLFDSNYFGIREGFTKTDFNEAAGIYSMIVIKNASVY